MAAHYSRAIPPLYGGYSEYPDNPASPAIGVVKIVFEPVLSSGRAASQEFVTPKPPFQPMDIGSPGAGFSKPYTQFKLVKTHPILHLSPP
ncbi:MAG: hypothetical protein C0404_06060 [Verrucomicrobia bacterium]|nr:hypothetical protein [Verrucomicrobiota bacterium]